MIPITWALQSLNGAYSLEADFSTLRKLTQLLLIEKQLSRAPGFLWILLFLTSHVSRTQFSFWVVFRWLQLLSSCFLGTVSSAVGPPHEFLGTASGTVPGTLLGTVYFTWLQQSIFTSCVTAQGTLQVMGIWSSEFFKSKNLHHQSANPETSVPLSSVPNKAVKKYTYKSPLNKTKITCWWTKQNGLKYYLFLWKD